YKRGLVESRGNLPMKPLSRTLLENDVVGELLDDPSAVRLRDYLDERVPDGQDDLVFADAVVYEMALAAIESGSIQALFSYAMDLGLEGCSSDPERLTILITNMFNVMPSWENNGWSPQELYEQLTGRKVFYNEDGSVKKVGADDPCPCGSGKKYRDCCGK
ncbi:MAG: SEC-C domain-containing protein, partial [Eggerthellaceae bacterium]|nr:SEC-C domain-containing protein [Eggerthellaceae bacterium]